jgi:hypothetical protein
MKKLAPSDQEIIKDLAIIVVIWTASVALIISGLKSLGIF